MLSICLKASADGDTFFTDPGRMVLMSLQSRTPDFRFSAKDMEPSKASPVMASIHCWAGAWSLRGRPL